MTPIGMVPLATEPTDLTRPRRRRDPVRAADRPFGYRPQRPALPGRRSTRVVASDTNTSVRWTIRSLDAGPGLEEADRPPFADPASPITYNTDRRQRTAAAERAS